LAADIAQFGLGGDGRISGAKNIKPKFAIGLLGGSYETSKALDLASEIVEFSGGTQHSGVLSGSAGRGG
jgi:hypothetical protein